MFYLLASDLFINFRIRTQVATVSAARGSMS